MTLTSALSRGIGDFKRALNFGAWGAAGGAAGAFIDEALGLGGRKEEWAQFNELVSKVGLWFAIIGALTRPSRNQTG